MKTARRHEGLQAARAAGRHLQGDGRSLGRASRRRSTSRSSIWRSARARSMARRTRCRRSSRGKFQEVQKFLVLTGHIITPRLVIVNDAAWKALPDADRGMLKAAIEAAPSGRTPSSRARKPSLVDTFKTAGMTVIEPDLESFRKPVLATRAEDVRGQMGQGPVREAAGDVKLIALGRSRADPSLRSDGRSPCRGDGRRSSPAAPCSRWSVLGVIVPRPSTIRWSGRTSWRSICWSGSASSAG